MDSDSQNYKGTSPLSSKDPYRPRLFKLSTGAIVFHHPCCICGQPAFIGVDCKLTGKERNPGRWYCEKDKPQER